MKLITHLSWLLRALLFLAIFAFALLNTDRVTLRFFLGQTWETPMIVVLLLFFAFGAGIGGRACSGNAARSTSSSASCARPAIAACRRRHRPGLSMDFELWWLFGFALFFGLGWLAARVDIKQLLSESRQLPRSYFKGLNFLLNEQPDKAIEAFIEVVKVDPETVELHFALGSLFRRRGE